VKYKAVLIDFDNTIIGTEKHNYRLFKKTIGGLIGRDLTSEDGKSFSGCTWKDIFEILAEKYLPDMKPEDIRKVFVDAKEEYFKSYSATIADGLDDILALDIKKGIVTGSSRAEVDMFSHCLDLSGFDIIATDELYENGKPAPDGYLYAAGELGLKPSECLCVEDSLIGLKSAKSAGCATVFTREFADEDHSRNADFTVNCLSEVINILN
jgi:HAD superfamily hydrolase (TIGR01509 family)